MSDSYYSTTCYKVTQETQLYIHVQEPASEGLHAENSAANRQPTGARPAEG